MDGAGELGGGGTGGWAWRGRRKKGEEGKSGLESWAAVAVVWASSPARGLCGWGSGLQLSAVKVGEAGVELGSRVLFLRWESRGLSPGVKAIP